jgi:hypothetical protein
MKEASQYCYEGFAGAMGWMFQGKLMPPWEKVAEAEKDAWRAGLQLAFQKGWTEQARPYTLNRGEKRD